MTKSRPATILEYFEETHPSEVRELLIEAHRFLQENLPPFATCGIKWRLPFYTLNRNICYLNRHPDHITLGFSFGYKLSLRPGVLLDENGTLKHIRYLELFSIGDLYSETVNGILQEALIIDEMMRRKLNERRIQNILQESFFS
ncbi:MAG: hypothetical protein IPJ30_16025 [Acidobacteria bacterium]|nr:hypothetical protein [Acidobacteriota bacterium]